MRRLCLRTILLALSLAMPVLVASPARALELFGVCLIGPCGDAEQNDIAVIDPYFYEAELTVVPASDGSPPVEGKVGAASNLWSRREDAVAGSAGLITRARGDYRRILAALYDAGHYGPSISIRINGREAADISPGSDLPKRSTVAIRVEPGPRFVFGRTEIVNQAPEDVAREDRVPLPRDEGFATGEPALAGRVRLAGELSKRAWRQLGYPKAELESRTATAVHPQRELDVTLRMDPGRRADYGDVLVEGTRYMDPAFVAYMTGIVSGEEFDPDDLERARERLDRLGVFSTRRILEADTITADGLLPIGVLVQEKKLRRIGLGATLSTIDGAGVEAFWLHRNLFGRAEQLKLTAKVGGLGSNDDIGDPENIDYLLALNFKKPGIINPDIDLVANVFAKREFNETFEERSAGGSLGFDHYVSKRVTLGYGVFGKYGEFDDAFGEREFTYFGAYGTALYDGRDSTVEPTEGFYLSAAARPFYETEFDNAAGRIELEGRTYFSPGERNRTVFAVRGRAGALPGGEIAETPPDLLFLAGGGGSVRGYGFNNIGVRGAADGAGNETTGGLSKLEGSIELRQRIGANFGVVAFADAGTVGEEPVSGFDEDVKIGVGVGVRYYTGLGPIRVDVAVPLDPEDDDPPFGIYAGIGQAF